MDDPVPNPRWNKVEIDALMKHMEDAFRDRSEDRDRVYSVLIELHERLESVEERLLDGL